MKTLLSWLTLLVLAIIMMPMASIASQESALDNGTNLSSWVSGLDMAQDTTLKKITQVQSFDVAVFKVPIRSMNIAKLEGNVAVLPTKTTKMETAKYIEVTTAPVLDRAWLHKKAIRIGDKWVV